MNDLLNSVSKPDLIEKYGFPLMYAIVILVVGYFVSKLITLAFKKVLEKTKLDATWVGFIQNVVNATLLIFVGLAALEKIGVETTSFTAMVAAAGLAIGLAFKDSLSNLAAGVMLVLFRPFKVGDFVEVSGTLGTVERIQIFHTNLVTPDNKAVVLPNGTITSGKITNFSAKPIRRLDLVIGVSYGDNLGKVRTILESILQNYEPILKDPAYTIGVDNLGDSSVDFAVRPWVKREDYLTTKFYLLETIKVRFDEEGISIPFPQRDIHVFNEDK